MTPAPWAIAARPGYPFARAVAAASAFWLDDLPAAKRHAATLAAVDPAFDAGGFLRTFGAHVDAVAGIAAALAARGGRGSSPRPT